MSRWNGKEREWTNEAVVDKGNEGMTRGEGERLNAGVAQKGGGMTKGSTLALYTLVKTQVTLDYTEWTQLFSLLYITDELPLNSEFKVNTCPRQLFPM